MSGRLPIHVQYRNGTYYGIFQNYQRNGHGLLTLDNSPILLAHFKKNQIHGKYIYISDNLRAYGQMLNSRLDGYNILWTKGQKGQKILYGMFRQDKLYGKAVTVDNGQVVVSQFANSQLKQIISKSAVRDRQVYDALTQHFPKNMYTLEEFLISFIKEASLGIQNQDQVSRYMPVVQLIGEDRFFGYEECFNKGRRFGFILKENKILSVGEHLGANLQGIGRYYAQDSIEDGIFKQGNLRGIGIKYYQNGNKYTLGQHDGKSTLEKGFGFPTREICQIRKQFHLRSIYFYNDIVMLGLNSHFTNLLNSLMMEGRPRITESPKFNQDYNQRGNNHTALYKYQIQNDVIQDSSPVRNKLSQYRPVDRKANKYFTLDQEEEDFDRRRQKQKGSLIHHQGRRNVPERETVPVHSRFNERNDPSSHSRGRMERDRSATRGAGRSGMKDTRQFVRELEQQQKRKRLDLDKIYRQAGLYRKK